MARCSTRGPCAAVSRGRQARRGVDRDVDSFSIGQDAPSKSPAPAHGLAGHGCPASAKRGGLSLWLSFSLATQRESNSGAIGGTKALASASLANELKRQPSESKMRGQVQLLRGPLRVDLCPPRLPTHHRARKSCYRPPAYQRRRLATVNGHHPLGRQPCPKTAFHRAGTGSSPCPPGLKQVLPADGTSGESPSGIDAALNRDAPCADPCAELQRPDK